MCPENQANKGGLCCESTQVNDNGLCKKECSLERPVEKLGVCKCSEGLDQLPNGLCCDRSSPNAACALAMRRKVIVKEYCLIKGNSGICKSTTDCTTMISPARGTCSEEFYVCCVVEAPNEVDSEKVKEYLDNVVSILNKMNSFEFFKVPILWTLYSQPRV